MQTIFKLVYKSNCLRTFHLLEKILYTMKIFGSFIFITIAVVFFSMSEVYAQYGCSMGVICPGRYICMESKCLHPCKLTIGNPSEKCGEHAMCYHHGQPDGKCVCEDNWDGSNPDAGCPLLIS